MRINVTALSIVAALFWSLAVLIVASANYIWPGYGGAFLELIASIYPGYDAASGVVSIFTGALYALVDGAIAGAVFGWLYNVVAQKYPD